jgi:hypothetical protein
MKMPWSRLEGPAKLLVMCLTILLVASGMCGLQWVVGSSGNAGNTMAAFLIPLGIIELIAIGLSAIGVVIVLIFWGARTIYRSLSGRDGDDAPDHGGPQTLFRRDDNEQR